SNNDYHKLFDRLDPTIATGILPSALAGRIAHVLDLRGPAVVIDTARSSSSLAIHESPKKIVLGEDDFASAGGINVFFTGRPVSTPSQALGWSNSTPEAYRESADIGIMS